MKASQVKADAALIQRIEDAVDRLNRLLANAAASGLTVDMRIYYRHQATYPTDAVELVPEVYRRSLEAVISG